jgi:hypothetical protein
MEKSGLTLRQVSAYALGSSNTLPHLENNPKAGLRLDTVDKVLSYIEKGTGIK